MKKLIWVSLIIILAVGLGASTVATQKFVEGEELMKNDHS